MKASNMYKTAVIISPATMVQPVLRSFILKSAHKTAIAMNAKYCQRQRKGLDIDRSVALFTARRILQVGRRP